MQHLEVKSIALRDGDGNINSFFVQTVSEMDKSNFIPNGMSSVSTTSDGVKIELYVKQSTQTARSVETPVVHQFSVSGQDLTPTKPILFIELINSDTTQVIRKRTVHRDDSDEDQMPIQ